MTQWSIEGKTCLITGANSGIGRETALELVKQGAGRVILACRNMETGKEAVEYIKDQANITNNDNDNRVKLRKLDLSSLKSIKLFCDKILEEEDHLEVLINNAGVWGPSERALTEDGFELSFGTNHIGHFYLTKRLLDLMKRSKQARIVIVAAEAYKFTYPFGFHIDDVNYENSWYQSWLAYSQSKLANILFARELNRRLQLDNNTDETNISVFSLHPGVIHTGLSRNRSGFLQWLSSKALGFLPLTSSLQDGVKTTIKCASEPGLEKHSGAFFSDRS